MSGIAVLFRRDGQSVSSDTLLRMCRAIVHRGPDDYGALTDGPVGLGVRRLEVIDPAGGHQPMASRSGRLSIVFDGAIYNHNELRRRLEERGVELRTKSDTEVILGLYQLFGARCVEHLVGMFAIAVWDAAQRTLLVARDRLGIKPLFLMRTGDGLAFASEVKSFVTAGLLAPRLRREVVPEYLRYGGLRGNATLFDGVEQLAPGERMVVSVAGERRDRYWRLPDPQPAERRSPAQRAVEQQHVERLGAELLRVVSDHLAADVPVGAWCGGGLAEALVAALAARGEALGLNTYGIGQGDAPLGADRAERLSKLHGTQHHRLELPPARHAELLEEAIWWHEAPLAEPRQVGALALARYAREKVKVVLTADGASELFGGAARHGLARRLDSLPRSAWVNRALRAWSLAWPAAERTRLRGALSPHGAIRVAGLSALVGVDQVRAVLVPGRGWDLDPRAHLVVPRNVSALSALLRVDQETRLQTVLQAVERLISAAGVEGRMPLLDHRLVEMVGRLPPAQRVVGGQWLLERLAGRHLPVGLLHPRAPAAPARVGDWLRRGGPLDGQSSMLLEPRTLERGLMARGALERAIAEHRTRGHDHGELLWGLLNLELWQRLYVDGEGTRFDLPLRASGEMQATLSDVRRDSSGEVVGAGTPATAARPRPG